jgi:hypothetical protein
MIRSRNWTTFFVVFSSLGLSLSSFADDKSAHEHGHGPCKQIEQACKNAGFIQGDWKKGDGLWRDCVDPIMQGQTNVPGATKSLPTVDAGLVSACKAKNPKFGSGKVGSAK